MLFEYIKSKIAALIVWALCSAVFAIISHGFSLPAAAVIYTASISLFFILVYFAVDFCSFMRKIKLLRHCAEEITLTAENLPEAKNAVEKEYAKMIETLFCEKSEILNESTKKISDLSDYYTIWAHQIKTPIAAARLILQSGIDEAELSEQLRRIEEYVQMAMCYVRLSSESTDFVFEEINADELIRSEVRKYSTQFIRKKLSLELKNTEKIIVSDKKWLGFIVGQVLSNAVKYTNSGGVSIYFEEPLTLCVLDTGIGISPEDLPRIFEKGYTGLNGRIDDKASGIGLYLCDTICRRLGHKITAQSDKTGTLIKIDLQRTEIKFD